MPNKKLEQMTHEKQRSKFIFNKQASSEIMKLSFPNLFRSHCG